MMATYFTIFSNCILVKGHNRSSLCDLHKNTVQLVPNDLYHIFEQGNCIHVETVLNELDSDTDRETFLEYLEFLYEEDYGFYSKKRPTELLKALPDTYHYPFALSNILIDLKYIDRDLLSRIKGQIEELHIRNVEIRVFDTTFNEKNLIELHRIFESSNVLTLSLLLPFDHFRGLEISEYCKFRFSRLMFFNCPEEQHLEYNGTKVSYSTKKDLSAACCGLIDQKYFSVNLPMYTESRHHNTCLNRKIAIDVDGYIKNCPSMSQSYGNIRDTTLGEAFRQPDFTKYWNIKKDQIQACKDCEFRHVCSDCRAFVEKPEDLYSKPLKCGYNPYTSEWGEWADNPLKQRAIAFYGLEKSLA